MTPCVHRQSTSDSGHGNVSSMSSGSASTSPSRTTLKCGALAASKASESSIRLSFSTPCGKYSGSARVVGEGGEGEPVGGRRLIGDVMVGGDEVVGTTKEERGELAPLDTVAEEDMDEVFMVEAEDEEEE